MNHLNDARECAWWREIGPKPVHPAWQLNRIEAALIEQDQLDFHAVVDARVLGLDAPKPRPRAEVWR